MGTNIRHGTNKQSTVSILLSGGIDSAACVAFYLEQNFGVHGVFVDYGQVAAERELGAAKAVAMHYHIRIDRLAWTGLHTKKGGLIVGRNAFFLVGALMELPNSTGIVAIGIHSGTEYVDCDPIFVRRMQSMFDAYTNGRAQIGAPFLKWTKRDIWTFCRSHEVPVELTYSCELGLDQPCGKCLSCRDLELLHACT